MTPKREITQLDRSLLDPNKTVEWNVFRQFDVDLDQLLIPGVLWNVRAFYAPQEVLDEIEQWATENYKTIVKAHGFPKMTKAQFKKELPWLVLDHFPSTNKENAAKEELQVYADIPSAPNDSSDMS